ncbi:LysR family transcriptional regulator [Advenella kashmirensis]
MSNINNAFQSFKIGIAMLDLVHIRSFVTLASELHFGRAARRLNMTQPPLSRQIRQLEDYLTVQLFDRTSHSVALTASGRSFLPEALALLRQSAEVEQAVRRVNPAKEGEITVGFIGAASYSFLPRFLVLAANQFPSVSVNLKELTAVQQLNALEFGEIDLGIVRPVIGFNQKEIESESVMQEELSVVLPLQNPLAQRQRLSLEDLRNEAFVMYHPDAPYLHSLLTDAFYAAGVFPPVVQSLTHAHAILSLVSVGMGVAIVPEEARNACFDNVVFRPIRLKDGITADLNVIYRRDTRNMAVRLLLDVARTLSRM